jgi:CMP-N-acetylneuraminic acid synthetase
MIPARLGSKRIKNKNLRLLGGRPLMSYVIESAKEAGIFDEIYVNSESPIFEGLCVQYGVRFYKRSAELAADSATNDMFVHDFLKNVECGILIQINPTSPFYTAEDIKDFFNAMVEGDYDAMHGVREEKIEAIFRGKALNFDPFGQMPRSQDLEPVLLHAGGLMGWKKMSYLENMKRYGCGTYGCGSKIGYFKLEGFSRIDIDNEEDLALAEAALQCRNNVRGHQRRYYDTPKYKET